MNALRPLRWTRQKLSALLSLFDGDDVPVVAIIFGVALIAYGASQIERGYGPCIVGIVLVLYVRPLMFWVKR